MLLNSKIIILCGGKGKRLGNITKKIPKPLVKVGKIPIIEHKLNLLQKTGFRKILFFVLDTKVIF